MLLLKSKDSNTSKDSNKAFDNKKLYAKLEKDNATMVDYFMVLKEFMFSLLHKTK